MESTTHSRDPAHTAVTPSEEPPPAYSAIEDLSSMNLNAAEGRERGGKESGFLIRPEDVVIAVMGITGSGKSTFISHFAKDVPVGHTLEACTSAVSIYQCDYDSKTKFYLVDTPGFDDTYRSDTDILREVADWLSQAYGKGIKLTGIVYLHRIIDVRLGGSAMKNLRMFKMLCGENALSSVVLATTWWAGVNPKLGAEREAQLICRDDFWAGMISKGSRVFRQDDGAKSAVHIVTYLINRKRLVTLRIQTEMNDDKKTLDQTGAGAEVDRQLAAQKREFEAKLQQLQEEMCEAMRTKDEEFQEDALAYKKEIEEKMKKAEQDRTALQADREELREAMEYERRRLIGEIEWKAKEMMEKELEYRVKGIKHANELAREQLKFSLERETAEKRRLEILLQMERKRAHCILM